MKENNNVHRGSRLPSSLSLATALVTPVAIMAAAVRQDAKNHGYRQNDNHKRYYDKHHKDCRTWDDNEGRSYQRYQAEHHEKRAFLELNSRQQTVYWTWRHNNPDNR